MIQHFRSPQTVIARFVARRNLRSATLWALVFGGYLASKAIGFADTYPTLAGREKAVALFTNNVGIKMILGPIRHADSVGGYAAWNTFGAMVIIGSIWAMLLATKTFRGEEDAGRWELLASGQTTARRAAANALAGLVACLGLFYVVCAATFSLVGRTHSVNFNVGAALFFALSVVVGVGIFMVIGALASQILPTRSRAASVTATIFGVCFLLRGIADITSAHWLLNITPLGWVEKLQPLANPQPIWLLPIAVFILAAAGLTIFLAGQRDLGEGILADKDTAKPHIALLKSPLLATVRLTRANSLGWLASIFGTALLYGLLTKSAAQAFSQSASAAKLLNRLAHQSQLASITAFLGVVFFLQMVFIMAYAASSLAAIRRDEAEGYLDNFVVRPYSRLRWLWGRVCLSTTVIIIAGLLTTLGVWIGAASQHSSLPIHTLLLAGVNSLVPAVVVVGVGLLAFGLRPRLTSLLAYGVLAWSFLIEMVSSGISLNHWILDTSVLNHMSLAPAGGPKWSTNLALVVLAVVISLIGAMAFRSRDLQGE